MEQTGPRTRILMREMKGLSKLEVTQEIEKNLPDNYIFQGSLQALAGIVMGWKPWSFFMLLS